MIVEEIMGQKFIQQTLDFFSCQKNSCNSFSSTFLSFASSSIHPRNPLGFLRLSSRQSEGLSVPCQIHSGERKPAREREKERSEQREILPVATGWAKKV